MSEPSSSINSCEGKVSEVIEEIPPLETGRKIVNYTANENNDSLSISERHVNTAGLSSVFKQNSQKTHSNIGISTQSQHISGRRGISIPIPLTTPTSEDLNSIAKDPFTNGDVLKQVEFYFSDNNLPKDKFLFRTIQANPEGWVAISTLAVFNRMKKFRPISRVVKALKSSEVLEVSMDDQMVKRRTPVLPMNDKEKDEVFRRTVYAKGFGAETENLQLEVEQWFSQFGSFKEVRLRRNDNKVFKNSVFVEFVEQRDAQKFVQLSPKPKFNGNEIMALIKPDYIEMLEHHKKFGGSKGIRNGRGSVGEISDDSRSFVDGRKSSRGHRSAPKIFRGSFRVFRGGDRGYCDTEDTSRDQEEIERKTHDSFGSLESNQAELTKNVDIEDSENNKRNDSFSALNSSSSRNTDSKFFRRSQAKNCKDSDKSSEISREEKSLVILGKNFKRNSSEPSRPLSGSSTKARGFDPREREPRELRDRTFDPRSRQPREPRPRAFDRAPTYIPETDPRDRSPRYHISSFPVPPIFGTPFLAPGDYVYRVEADHPPLRGGYGPPPPICLIDNNASGYVPPQAEYSRRVAYSGSGTPYNECLHYERDISHYPDYERYYPLIPEYSRGYSVPSELFRSNPHTSYDKRQRLGFPEDLFPPRYDGHSPYVFNPGPITGASSDARTLPSVPLDKLAGSRSSHGRHETEGNSPRSYSYFGHPRAEAFESPSTKNCGSSGHANPRASGRLVSSEEASKLVNRTPGPIARMPILDSRFHGPDEHLLPPEYSQILEPAQPLPEAQIRPYQTSGYSGIQGPFPRMQGPQYGYGRSPSGYNDYF